MTSLHSQTQKSVEAATRQWIHNVVLGLNLCPFAHAVVKSEGLDVVVVLSPDTETVLHNVVEQAEQMLRSNHETTVIVALAHGFDAFADYLDVLDLAQALFDELELTGKVQIASFHPHYQFSDSDYDDKANYTNRSPYPLLHLLQESAVSKAVDQHPDAAAIPDRNVKLLRTMKQEELDILCRLEGNVQ